VKLGSRVRLIGVPDGLEDYPDLPTKSIFAKCVGHDFIVQGFNKVGMAELEITSVTGKVGETIWVEKRFLKVIKY